MGYCRFRKCFSGKVEHTTI